MKTKAKESNIQTASQTVLLSASDCASMCRISRRSWFRLKASARVPACVYIGSSPRWIRKTVERWIELGCPDRTTFEAMQQSGGK